MHRAREQPVAAPLGFLRNGGSCYDWEWASPTMWITLIIDVENLVDNFICTKCYKIKEVQEKITDLRMKIYQMTEPNTASKEATKLHETLKSVFFLITSAGIGTRSALFASTLPVPGAMCGNSCRGTLSTTNLWHGSCSCGTINGLLLRAMAGGKISWSEWPTEAGREGAFSLSISTQNLHSICSGAGPHVSGVTAPQPRELTSICSRHNTMYYTMTNCFPTHLGWCY